MLLFLSSLLRMHWLHSKDTVEAMMLTCWSKNKKNSWKFLMNPQPAAALLPNLFQYHVSEAGRLVRLPPTGTNTSANLFFYHFKNTLKFPWIVKGDLYSWFLSEHIQPADERPAAPRRMQRAVMRLRGVDEEDGSGAWLNHTPWPPGKHKRSPVQPQRWQLLAFYCTSQAEGQNSK